MKYVLPLMMKVLCFKLSACGQIGVDKHHPWAGLYNRSSALKLYAVEPVGVDTIIPSDEYSFKKSPSIYTLHLKATTSFLVITASLCGQSLYFFSVIVIRLRISSSCCYQPYTLYLWPGIYTSGIPDVMLILIIGIQRCDICSISTVSAECDNTVHIVVQIYIAEGFITYTASKFISFSRLFMLFYTLFTISYKKSHPSSYSFSCAVLTTASMSISLSISPDFTRWHKYSIFPSGPFNRWKFVSLLQKLFSLHRQSSFVSLQYVWTFLTTPFFYLPFLCLCFKLWLFISDATISPPRLKDLYTADNTFIW